MSLLYFICHYKGRGVSEKLPMSLILLFFKVFPNNNQVSSSPFYSSINSEVDRYSKKCTYMKIFNNHIFFNKY